MRRILILGLAAGVAALSACSDELPTSVGSGLLQKGFRTFDVVLDAGTFLQSDTTFDQLGTLNAAPFGLVAESFAGELFAHTLFRINRPTRVTFEDEAGETVTDSIFTVVGGTVTLVLDSLREETGPVELEVVEVTESWEAGSVTWEQRFDTAGVSAAWLEPGGTTGRLLGEFLWQGGDTVRIPLDSASATVWMDSASAFHGGLIRSDTDGTRLRIQSLSFAFDARPESADTVLEAGSAGQRAVVVTPEPSAPAPAELRVGGLPAWRSALEFRPLADIRIPCEPGSTTCTLPLSEADVSLATLLLQPMPVGSRRIERPFQMEAREVLRAPGVPVNRSPLSTSAGAMNESLVPEAFLAEDPPPDPSRVPITGYVRRNIDPPGDEQEPVRWLALLSRVEQSAPLFGYAAFGSVQSAAPPRLRLVVTVPIQEELP